MVIIALDIMLCKVDPDAKGWWFYITLMSYHSYCYLEYKLTDNDDK